MPIVPIASTEASEPKLPPARVRTRLAPDAAPADEPGRVDPSPEAAPDYKVGYRQPPKHTQYKPGQSGNSKGRPKAAKGLQSIVRETLTQKVAVRTATGTRKISRIEAVLQKTVEQAMKGNPRALAELIKLYGNAVPEEKEMQTHDEPEDLTATDLATLEELRRMLSSDEGNGDEA